jgi:hypothetical protein
MLTLPHTLLHESGDIIVGGTSQKRGLAAIKRSCLLLVSFGTRLVALLSKITFFQSVVINGIDVQLPFIS